MISSRYVHVLIQKMAVNVDLGFILSLVDFFSLSGTDPLFQVSIGKWLERLHNVCGSHTSWVLTIVFMWFVFQTEYVENDMDYVSKSLKETVVPEVSHYLVCLIVIISKGYYNLIFIYSYTCSTYSECSITLVGWGLQHKQEFLWRASSCPNQGTNIWHTYHLHVYLWR